MPRRTIRKLRHGDDVVPPGGLWPFDSWIVIDDAPSEDAVRELAPARHSSETDEEGTWKTRGQIYLDQSELRTWSRVSPEIIRRRKVEYFSGAVHEPHRVPYHTDVVVKSVAGHGALVWIPTPEVYFRFETLGQATDFADALERFELPPLDFWYPLEGDQPEPGLRVQTIAGEASIKDEGGGRFSASLDYDQIPGKFRSYEEAFQAIARELKHRRRPA